MEFDFGVFIQAITDASSSMDKAASAIQARAERASSGNPIHLPVFGSLAGVNNPGGTVLLQVPEATSPDVGRVWEVVKLGIFGNDDHTAVGAATATIYGGPTAGMTNPGDLPSVLATGVTIPTVTLVGEDRIWLHHGDMLYAWVYSSPVNQQLSLVALVYDYPVWAKEGLFV